MLDVEPLPGNVEPCEDLGLDVTAVLDLLPEGVVTSPVEQPGDRIPVPPTKRRFLSSRPIMSRFSIAWQSASGTRGSRT